MSDALARFTQTIAQRLGLRLEPERAVATEELIARRAEHHHDSIAGYLDRIDAAELRVLARELTVGETYFFRHVEQFTAFTEVVLPQRSSIAVLSAGCASGEEAYTLAILVRERGVAATIHAIDVNAAALERAAAGRYSRWALRATPADIEARWFQPVGREYQIAPALRDAVTFEERNLVDDSPLWAPGRWDAIFCRNVLMYFTEERAREVIARFARALAPGGYLFLGHAETLRGRSDDFGLCHSHGTFYYQRGASEATQPLSLASLQPLSLAPPDTSWIANIQTASDRITALFESSGSAVARSDAQRGGSIDDPPPEPRTLAEVRELIGSERFPEALVALAELPADRDAALLRAIVLAHTGRFAEAEAACGSVLDRGDNAGARYVLALCRDSAGDQSGAAHHARLASALDPSFAMASLHLGLLARRAGNRESANAELARAIVLLEREPAERLQLYGGGFGRRALVELCRTELAKGAP